jgi:hypothetical protein
VAFSLVSWCLNHFNPDCCWIQSPYEKKTAKYVGSSSTNNHGFWGFFFTLEGWDTHGYPPDLVFACITLHSAACDNPQKGKLRLCYRNHSPFQLPIENGEHPQLCQIARGYHEQVWASLENEHPRKCMAIFVFQTLQDHLLAEIHWNSKPKI